MNLMVLQLGDRDMMVIHLLLLCKRDNFQNHLPDCWNSSSKVPLKAPLIAREALY